MPLRAVTLIPTARRVELSRDGWRQQLETTVMQAAAALRSDDLATVSEAWDDLSGWADGQRAYQARRQLTELAFSAGETLPVEQCIDLYLLVGDKLLDALWMEPSEPVLLNYAGVILYELGELTGADALFAAAQRLDGELEHVAENRKAIRRRRRSAPPPLPAPLRAPARALAARAKPVAARARPKSDQTLSLVMIVKNEEEMLPGCLEAARPAVDEIVVVDTGSTDRTLEIAESFGAKVVHFPWNGSFADARNCSLEHATGDWIVYLDADEHLVPEDAPKLRALTGRTWREAFYLVETNYTGGDESGSSVAHLAMRVFKRKPEYRFEGRIHEQKTQAMPTYLGERFETTAIRLRHYGYLKSRINAKEKSRRNIELLEVEAREAPGPFVDFNLGSEYMSLGAYEQARTYLDRAWDLLRREEGWSGKGYAPMLVVRVVQTRREAGDTAAARTAIDEGLKYFPDHTELVLQAGLCAKADGNLDEAARCAERCLELGEAPTGYSATVGCGSFLAQCLLAEVRTAQGRTLEAEELLLAALTAHPDYVAPVLPLASSMLKRGLDPAAVRSAIPTKRPSALVLVATALYEEGHSEAAEAAFRDVLADRPDDGVARIGLVEALLSRRNYEEAAREAALEPTGSPLAAAATGAELFARAAAGDAASLAGVIARAPERSVRDVDVELYTAWQAQLAGTPGPAVVPAAAADTALTALEALLRVQDFAAFATLLPVYESIDLEAAARRDALARVYFARGYLESAAEEWIAAYAERPEAASLIGLAQVAFARGLPDEAREFAGEALALAPDDPRASRLVSSLAQRAVSAGSRNAAACR